MPRKKLSRTKTEQIQFALYPEEKAAFEAWCQHHGLTMSDVLRGKIKKEIEEGTKVLNG